MQLVCSAYVLHYAIYQVFRRICKRGSRLAKKAALLNLVHSITNQIYRVFAQKPDAHHTI